MKEHVAIVGSRPPEGAPVTWLSQTANLVNAYVQKLSYDTTVVSGGAGGVDRLAAAAATKRGLPVMILRPDWEKYGKSAGAKRNQQIVDISDRVVAFWDGESRGTKITIDMARKKGIPCEIIKIP